MNVHPYKNIVLRGEVRPPNVLIARLLSDAAILDRAWDIARGDSTIIVAVLDTGIDGVHTRLALIVDKFHHSLRAMNVSIKEVL